MPESFDALVTRVDACRACPRMEGRRRVLGAANGRPDSRLLVVAAAPGRLGAERTGVPLCGDRSGAMFESLLHSVGLERDDIFVTNAVLCNPQDGAGRNAPPSPAELRACAGHLAATLEVVTAPRVLALGRVAFAALLRGHPAALGFEDCLGRWQPWMGRRLGAAYHPGPRVTADPRRRAAMHAQWRALFAATPASVAGGEPPAAIEAAAVDGAHQPRGVGRVCGERALRQQ